MNIFAFAYFFLADIVYTNNALFVYVSKSESGGLLWNGAFKRIVAGLMFAHFLLGCYMLVRWAWLQMMVMGLLILTDFVLLAYCYRAFELPSTVVPLSVAALKDKTELEAKDRCAFSNQLYEQPALRLEYIEEEPFEPNLGPISMADEEILETE